MKVSFATNTDNNTLDRGQVTYLGILGAGSVPAPEGNLHASYNQNSTLMGGGGGTVSNFRIELSAAPGSGRSWSFRLRKNGSNTAVSITISGASTTGSNASSVSFVDGDWFQWMITPSGTPAYTTLLTGCLVNTTNPFFSISIPLSSVGTRYSQCHSQVGSYVGTEGIIHKQYLPSAGTLKNMRILVSDAPGAGETYTVTLRKNGSDQSLEVVVSGTDTTGSDTSNTVDVVTDDYITYKIVASGGAVLSSSLKVIIEFEPDGAAFPYMTSPSTDTPNSTFSSYLFPNCGALGNASGTVEIQGQYIFSAATTLDRLYIRLSVSPGGGKSYTFTILKNGVPTDLVIVIADSDTTGSDLTHSVVVADGDKITLKSVPSGSPTGGTYQFTFAYVPGAVYPSNAITRVTNIIHRYVRKLGVYTLEMNLGSVTSEFALPDWPGRPIAAIRPADPLSAEDIERIIDEKIRGLYAPTPMAPPFDLIRSPLMSPLTKIPFDFVTESFVKEILPSKELIKEQPWPSREL